MKGAGATRWMVLRVCWNGCRYAYDFWVEYLPGSYDARIERVRVCIDTCVDLYVLARIAGSCMGAWDGVMMC